MVIDNAGQAPGLQAVTVRKKRRNLLTAIFTVGALLLVSLGGLGWLVLKPTTHEVVMQPAGFVTENPFAADPFAGAPDPKLAKPTDKGVATPNAPLTQKPQDPTANVAIYGGSGSHTLCDAGKFLQFMEKSPKQAQAWVDALNADSTLGWTKGKLTVADIPAYVQTLAPVVLLTDTLVINHDFINNKSVPYQSVLQAGTAVLADMWGTPRLQCYCGNPLTLPSHLAGNVKFTGTPWQGFDPSKVVQVQQPNKPVNQLTVTNLNGGGTLTVGPLICDPATNTCTPAAGGNATSPTTPTTPTTPQPQSAFYVKPSPPTPSADICSGLVGSRISTVPGSFDFTATNNSSIEVDLWATQMTWTAAPGDDPDYGGVIDTCDVTYIGTLPPGASDSTLSSGAFQMWAAFEGTNGTGPVSSHTNLGDRATWSIQ